MDRELLRDRQGGRGDQPDQRDADARRGRLCGQGLRREGAVHHRRPGRAHPVAEGRRASGRDCRLRRGRGRGLLQYARRFGVGGFRAREGRPRIALDHLLHLGHHRLPQGRHAEPPVGDPQRRGDGGDEHAHEPRRAAHGAALRACLWRHADEPQLPVRLDAGALREIRRKRSLAGHPGLPRHRHRRRADDVFLHAGAPGIREIRPVLAAALGHRRADHAGRQGGGVAPTAPAARSTNCGG